MSKKSIQPDKIKGALLLMALICVAYAGAKVFENMRVSPPADNVQAYDAEPKLAEEPANATRHQRAKGAEIPAYLNDRPEEIVIHTAYTVSFNRTTHLANWVAWELTEERSRANTISRYDWFDADPDVKSGSTATYADYKGSGYDRGHMCPAADNKMSKQAMVESFYMSNICPQTHALNHGDWEQLESLCRRWARLYGSIYIVCGPIINKEETYATIGRRKITVPTRFFKVIMRTGQNARRTSSGSTAEGIGFVFNNDETSLPLSRHAMSIDQVEELTGINFFSKLPKEVERRAEATFDCKKWNGIN